MKRINELQFSYKSYFTGLLFSNVFVSNKLFS